MNANHNMIPKAVDVWFTEWMLYVRLEDGREVGVPLDWFPKLKNANLTELKQWQLIGHGVGIRWQGIDEDISVSKLIFG
jgi:hypothetical protein